MRKRIDTRVVALALASFALVAWIYLSVIPGMVRPATPVTASGTAERPAAAPAIEPDSGAGRDAAGSGASTSASTAPASAQDPIRALGSDLADLLSQGMLELDDLHVLSFATNGWARFKADELASAGVGPDDLLALLSEAQSGAMRGGLLVLVGEMGLPSERIDEVAGFLDSPETRAAAAVALAGCGSEAALDRLMARIDGEETGPEEVRDLAFGLARAGERAVPRLLSLAEGALARGEGLDPDELLGWITDRDARDELLDIVRDHPDDAIRRMALTGLLGTRGDFGSETDALARLAADPEESGELRDFALIELAKIDGGAALELVLETLEDPSSSVEERLSALRAAGVAGASEEDVDLFARFASSSADPQVRAEAVRVLATSGGARADAALATLLRSASGAERSHLLASLLQRGMPHRFPDNLDVEPVTVELSETLIDEVEALLRDPEADEGHWMSAASLLRGAGRDDIVDELVRARLASSVDPEERARELVRLGPLLGPGHTRDVISAFASSRELVSRAQLLDTLRSIAGGGESGELASFLENDALPYFRGMLQGDGGDALASMGAMPLQHRNTKAVTALFARYGEPSDLSLVEGVEQRFLADKGHWPESLREQVARMLGETSLELADAIRLRHGR